MSLNACTINKCSINAFCADRRSLVFDRLVLEAHPIQPPLPSYGGHGSTAVRNPIYYDRPQEIPRVYEPIEQPFIVVTVDIFGKRGSQTIELSSQQDFVTVTNISFETDDELTVNISELTF